MTAIAEALNELRERTGLTDDALANAIGVKQATFTRWRNGKIAVHPRHTGKLATLLRLPRDQVARMLGQQDRPADPIEKGTVGWLLRKYELNNGFTAQQAYEQLGVEISTYHKWRKNLVLPGAKVIAPLAARLGVSEQTLVMAVYRTELWRLSRKER